MTRIGSLMVVTACAWCVSCATVSTSDRPPACRQEIVEVPLPDAHGARLDAVDGGYILDDRAMARLAAEGPACQVQLRQSEDLRALACDGASSCEAEVQRLRRQQWWVVGLAAAGDVVLIGAVVLAATVPGG